MDVMKPDAHELRRSLPEIILRWILSNIKGTPEQLQKEIEKNIKY